MSIENQINLIAKIYPWALDATLAESVKIKGSSNLSIMQAISILKSGKPLSVDKLVKTLLKSTDINQSLEIIKRTDAKAKSMLNKITSDSDPVSSITGLIEDITWTSRDGTKAISDWTKNIPYASNIARGLDLTALGIAGSATFLKLAFNLIKEQEETARTMINYGLISTDQSIYGILRDNFAGMGMSLAEGMESLGKFGSTVTSLGQDSVSGFTAFSSFAEDFTKNNTADTMGYNSREATARLLSEASLLNYYNEINELNANARIKITRGFQTSAALATRYAEMTGQQRDNLLDMRNAALSDNEAIYAFNRNMDYMTETFGEGSAERAKESYGQLAMLMPMLGEDISKGLMEGLARAQYDVKFNTSAIDNIESEIFRQFQILGPGVSGLLSEIFSTSITGGYTNPDQLTADWQELIRRIQAVPPIDTYVPENEGAVQIQAMANIVPDSFLTATGEAATARISTIRGMVGDGADDAVIAMDNMRKTLTEMYDGIVFHVGNANTAFSGLSGILAVLTGIDDEELENISRTSLMRNEERRSAASQSSIRRRAIMEQIEGMSYSEAVAFMTEYAERAGFTYTPGTGFTPMPISDSTAEEIQAMQAEGGILSFIGKGEGSYTASNRGTIGNRIVGSTMDTIRNGKALTDMTFEEIFALQSIDDANNPNRLFAVGRYQIIPETMREIWPHSGLRLTDKFSPENQDKLGTLLLVGSDDGYTKRGNLAAYIRGESNNLEAAMLDFAMEWASAPDPRTGFSYYGSGNRASHTIQEVATALRAARADYAERQRLGTTTVAETVAPTVATPTIAETNAVPPRPSRWQNNGFLPGSPRHPQNIWDRQYGDTHNPDGTPKNTGDEEPINNTSDEELVAGLTSSDSEINVAAYELVNSIRQQNASVDLTR